MKLTIIQRLFFLGIICTIFSCSSSKTTVTKQDVIKLEDFLNKKYFKIEVNSAEPQVTAAFASVGNSGLLPPGSNIARIDLTGDGNYLKVKGDSVFAYLPYFGERQMGGTYGNKGAGIKIDGKASNFRLVKGKKDNFQIKFNADDEESSAETYTISLKIFPSRTSTISINSTHRNTIRYNGRVTEIKKKS